MADVKRGFANDFRVTYSQNAFFQKLFHDGGGCVGRGHQITEVPLVLRFSDNRRPSCWRDVNFN